MAQAETHRHGQPHHPARGVAPGARLPGVPLHRFKASFDWSVTPKLKFGVDALATSGFYLVGDPGNANPQQSGYAVVNLRGSYKLTDQIEVYGLVNNALDRRYVTTGGYFDTTSIPALGLSDPRTLAPAAPRAFYAGVRAKF